MGIRLKASLMISIILFIIIMIGFIKRDNINIKYALLWLISGFLVLIAILIPNLLEKISHFLGFELMSNMIFFVAILVLFALSLSFTIIISKQTQKIRLLIQEISLLKTKMEGMEKNEKK